MHKEGYPGKPSYSLNYHGCYFRLSRERPASCPAAEFAFAVAQQPSQRHGRCLDRRQAIAAEARPFTWPFAAFGQAGHTPLYGTPGCLNLPLSGGPRFDSGWPGFWLGVRLLAATAPGGGVAFAIGAFDS